MISRTPNMISIENSMRGLAAVTWGVHIDRVAFQYKETPQGVSLEVIGGCQSWWWDTLLVMGLPWDVVLECAQAAHKRDVRVILDNMNTRVSDLTKALETL